MIVILNLFDIIPGKEAEYAEYLRRIQPLLEQYRAKVLLYGQTRMVYMGTCPQQYCGLIAYESIDDLRDLSADPDFVDIRSLRDDCTENYVLTAVDAFETMQDAVRYLENSGQ